MMDPVGVWRARLVGVSHAADYCWMMRSAHYDPKTDSYTYANWSPPIETDTDRRVHGLVFAAMAKAGLDVWIEEQGKGVVEVWRAVPPVRRDGPPSSS